MKRFPFLLNLLFTLLFAAQQVTGQVPPMAQGNALPPEETPLPEIQPIDPPVATWPYPLWMMIVAGVLALIVLGLIIWAIWRVISRRPGPPPPTPKEKALTALGGLEAEVENVAPYAMSIETSDVLRHYLTQAHGLAATEQTSVEFLATIARDPHFSDADKTLLALFLEKADLIKFARLAATSNDSRELIAQAQELVRRESAPELQPGEVA